MIEKVYLVFEILAFLFCLYGLYGQKFQWNIYTILCIGLEVMFYQIADVSTIIRYFEPIVFLMLFIYLRIQFKGKWRTSIINFILCILISLTLQLICYIPMIVWYNQLFHYRYVIVNILFLAGIVLLYKSRLLFKFSQYMNQKGRMVMIFLISMLLTGIYALYTMKIYTQLRVLDCAIIISSVILLFAIIFLLQKERLRNQQMTIERNMNQLYGNALMELIEKVKVNQHNYKNHLVAIQGMTFTATSLDTLREEQKRYFSSIQQEERYSNLLSGNNDPIITGFLYSKLCNICTNNITVDYSVHMQKMENSFFLFDVIQILGVLIDNAIEEILKEQYDSKKIRIEIEQKDNVTIKVSNICKNITMNEMSNFFKKGYSTKGQDRGIGLYSVKELVKKWNGDIYPCNDDQNGENWFSIIISFPQT